MYEKIKGGRTTVGWPVRSDSSESISRAHTRLEWRKRDKKVRVRSTTVYRRVSAEYEWQQGFLQSLEANSMAVPTPNPLGPRLFSGSFS